VALFDSTLRVCVR